MVTVYSTKTAGLQIAVSTRTRPEGLGPDQTKRAVEVFNAISITMVPDDESEFTVGFSPLGVPTVENPIGTSDYSQIGTASQEEKAFWVFDVAITAAEFQASVGAISVGTVQIDFPGLGATSFTIYEGVHILDQDYDEWDTILHEYGHAVAQEAGFSLSISGRLAIQKVKTLGFCTAMN